MPNQKLIHFALLASLIALITACSTTAETVEQRQKRYEVDARTNDKFAEDWRNAGNEDMAKHHEQQADKARHNKYAAGCDYISLLIFDALLGSDACSEK